MKNLLKRLPVPQNVSAVMVVVYVVYGLVGLATVFEAWRETPSHFYTHDLDAYWYVTGTALALSGLNGAYGAWTGRWDVERVSVVALVFTVCAQALVTFYGLRLFNIQTPFFITSIAGTVGLLATRWFRISKDWRDPSRDREQVRLEKRAYERALTQRG